MTDEQQNPQLAPPQPDSQPVAEQPATGGFGAGTTVPEAASWMEKINQSSVVASSPQQKKFMILGLLVFALIIGYYLTFGRTQSIKEIKEQEAQNLAQKKESVVKSAMPVTAPVLSSSAPTQAVDLGLSTPKELQEPTPPAPPVAPLPPVPAAVFAQEPPPVDPAPVAPPTQSPPPADVPSAPTSFSNNLSSSNILKTAAERAAEEEAAKLKKRNSGIIVFGSGGSITGSDGTKDDGSDKTKDKTTKSSAPSTDFLGFGNGNFDNVSVGKTSASQVIATTVGNTDNLILQGKMINAVLETAINTDLPGSLRAIITRDVYADSGNRILVPKGSRVIGTYTNTVSAAQVRVQVTWSRLVRPDGIDIAVNSVGTDNLGRSGVVGTLDSKMWTQLGAALLVSYIIPSVVNKITGVADQASSQSTSTSNGVTTATTTGNTSAVSASAATSQFSTIAQNTINSAFPSQPTITVDQGTLISILVQADLVFPSESALAQQKVVK